MPLLVHFPRAELAALRVVSWDVDHILATPEDLQRVAAV